MVEWMAGRNAAVTAIDIDTRFIEPLASDKVEVRRIDLRTDQLPQPGFDVIDARLVLEHLPERRQVIERLAGALRPGGWLVIEDYDWTGFGWELDDDQFDRVTAAIMTFMQRAGYEPRYGRGVVSDIAAAGLSDVRGQGRAHIIDSRSPGFGFFKLSFESLRGAIVDAGLLSVEDADAAAARFHEERRVLTPTMMAGIGRRA